MAMPETDFRVAGVDDLPEIIRLLADDVLGATREIVSDPVREEYRSSFQEICDDPNTEILVALHENTVVGTLQLTCIPNLTLLGTRRALIEGVRIDSRRRGQGLGRQLMAFALDRARRRGCRLAQLTTNKKRPEALEFYRSLGFEATHEGMKLALAPPGRD